MDRLIVTIPLLFLLLAAKLAMPAPELREIYVPNGWKCPRCEVVKDRLARLGVQVVKVCTSAGAVPKQYPEARYRDGSRTIKDNGRRVLAGRCKFARKVYVITWMGEGS